MFAPEGQLIAYTLDDSDPRASGGTPAGNAVLVATSLTLPAGITATVRIYNPSTPTPAVGSAWSSAVVIDSSATVKTPGYCR